MVTDSAPETAANSTDGPAASRGGVLKIAVIIVAITLVEAVAFYLFLGPGAATPLPEDGDATSAVELASQPGDDSVECAIDSFNCTNNRADPGSVIHVSFKAVALVSPKNLESFDLAANKDNKARVRQAIVKVVRSSGLEELNDPNLSTIKRLIREEVNKILRKSYVIEIVILEFTTMEQ